MLTRYTRKALAFLPPLHPHTSTTLVCIFSMHFQLHNIHIFHIFPPSPQTPLTTLATGSGDIEELSEHLEYDQAAFGLYRTTDVIDEITVVKFVYIVWLVHVFIEHCYNNTHHRSLLSCHLI